MKIKLLLLLVVLPLFLSGYAFRSHLSDDWYPSAQKELVAFFDNLEQKNGACPQLIKNDKIAAIVVPHAGYRYSGDVAVSAYRSLDPAKIKRVIILAPSHTEYIKGVALPSFDRYITPLGSLMVDTTAIRQLKKNPLYQERDDVWRMEHAVEVQLPFINRYLSDMVKIVPLIVGNVGTNPVSLAQSLADIIDNTTVIVVSSDFTHYGPRFKYMPFTGGADVQAKIKDLDSKLIDALINKDASAFATVQQETGATVCGREPLILFKTVQQLLPHQLTAKLLCYKTSYDVDHSDPNSSVSYAAITFERKQPILSLSVDDKQAMLRAVRNVIASTCDNKKVASFVIPSIPALKEYRGLFVTLRTKNGDLRGCMGRVIPDKPLNELLPVIAQLAAFGDPRFAPVSCQELADLRIEISILSLPYDVKGYQEIVLGKHGIILKQGDSSALFLPQVAVEQHWDLPTTLRALAEKAGLSANAWQQPATTYQLFEGMEFSE